MWFLALYLPDPWQWPTIVGMITIGLANYGAALGLYLTARSARSETFGAAVRA